jgi:hypothetical protein
VTAPTGFESGGGGEVAEAAEADGGLPPHAGKPPAHRTTGREEAAGENILFLNIKKNYFYERERERVKIWL